MRVRFYIDPETERPHVENHGVTVREVVETLERARQDYMGDQGARIALGQSAAGRYLKVIYRPHEYLDEIFVITAYQLRGNELKAFRKRIRRS